MTAVRPRSSHAPAPDSAGSRSDHPTHASHARRVVSTQLLGHRVTGAPHITRRPPMLILLLSLAFAGNEVKDMEIVSKIEAGSLKKGFVAGRAYCHDSGT